MIEIQNLTKRFGDFVAVNNLSFTINAGEVVGFLGPNGAGKSTTMKMLTGFLSATSGSVTINGLNIEQDALAIKQGLGYLPEGAPAYGDMTVLQFLSFIADVRGLTGRKKQARLARVIKDVQLAEVLDKNIDTLSKGFKRRVGLAQAIIHDPKVLILDEPTDGLDPNQKHQVRALIQNLAKDKIVIISTHILEEVTAVCNRALIIANGSKIFDDTPEQLQKQSPYHHAVSIELTEMPSQPEQSIQQEHSIQDELKTLEHVASVSLVDNKVTVFPTAGQNIFTSVYQKVQTLGWKINAIYSEKGRLDDIFRQLTVSNSAKSTDL